MRLCVVLAELPPNVPEMLALGAVFESVNPVASEWRRGARYGVGEKVAAVCPGHRVGVLEQSGQFRAKHA